jgi:tetratricopeptide (TPR) repeat protein
MLRLLMVFVLMATASPAWAQTQDDGRARCMNPNPDTKIAGCTAVILSGQETAANLAVAYSNRSDAYEAKGLHDLAIADASTAIGLSPSHAAAFNARAWAYHGKGDDARGLPDAQKAVELAPNDAYVLETRAEIYEKLGQREKAIADYRTALAIDPDLREAQDGLRRLGIVLLK